MSTDLVEAAYKDIAGFPGYRVGSDGSVWSRWQRNPGRKKTLRDEWKLLSPIMECNYLRLTLMIDGKKVHKFVHLLVLEAFIGPKPKGMQGCHYNGTTTDNRLANLRWDTPLGNAQDTKRLGRIRPAKGELNNASKLTAEKVLAIRELALKGETVMSLAKQFGVAHSNISLILSGKRWSHI